jgi:excisionase family DNA binding protein
VTERLLTARQLAEALGVSPHTVLDWAQRGEVPSFKLPNGAVRFRPSEVEAWLEAHRLEATVA